jgi:protein-disulfide isomerase
MGVGAAISAVYVGVIAVDRLFCAYCVAVHVANFAMTFAAWRVARSAGGAKSRTDAPRSSQVAWVLATFALTTAILGGVESSRKGAIARRSEAELATSQKAIRDAGASSRVPTPPQIPQQTKPVATTPSTTTPVTALTRPALTGRYRWGPEVAAVRVVMFTDYQCPDCALMEEQVNELMRGPARSLSISIKYFPFSIQCNPSATSDPHPNACWAARAAEAAGILYGPDGFWKMHRWLFSVKGSFTDAEFKAGLARLGFDSRSLIAAMEGAETITRVKADVEEAVSLGIYNTPFIFINGVELRGWTAPRALVRAVESAFAASPAPAGPEFDLPPDGPEKMLEDWKRQPVVQLPDRLFRRSIGKADAPVRIVIFGDYQEPFSGDADSIARLFTTGPDANVRYAFAQFPVNQSCNPSCPITKHPMACVAARAAEAADLIGGTDGYWRMHSWLMSSRSTLNEKTVLDGASLLGMDAATFSEAMIQPQCQADITEDAATAIRLGLQSVPHIFINGRLLARYKSRNENIIPRVIRAAAAIATEAPAPTSAAPGGPPASSGPSAPEKR